MTLAREETMGTAAAAAEEEEEEEDASSMGPPLVGVGEAHDVASCKARF